MKTLEGTFNKEKTLVGALSGHCERLVDSSNVRVVRWAIFQLDRTLLEEVDGCKGADIPVTERSELIASTVLYCTVLYCTAGPS